MKIKTMFALAVTFLPAIGNAGWYDGWYEGKVSLVQSPTASRNCFYFRVDQGGSPWFSLLVTDNVAYRDISNIVMTARTYEKTIRVKVTGRQHPACGSAEIDLVRY